MTDLPAVIARVKQAVPKATGIYVNSYTTFYNGRTAWGIEIVHAGGAILSSVGDFNSLDDAVGEVIGQAKNKATP